MATQGPSDGPRMPRSGHSAVPTAEAANASAALGQEDAAIAHLPENATEPGAAPRSTEEPGGKSHGPPPTDRLPPAGSHADPSLMNPDATPGTGVLPPVGEHDDVDSASS